MTSPVTVTDALAVYDSFVTRLRARLAAGDVLDFREVTQDCGGQLMFFCGRDFSVVLGGSFQDTILFPEHDR